MTFFVDDKPVLRTVCSCKQGNSKVGWYTPNETGAVMSACAPFDRPFHIVINLAIGGQWPGNPNRFTTFPQTMSVQWVKVWAL